MKRNHSEERSANESSQFNQNNPLISLLNESKDTITIAAQENLGELINYLKCQDNPCLKKVIINAKDLVLDNTELGEALAVNVQIKSLEIIDLDENDIELMPNILRPIQNLPIAFLSLEGCDLGLKETEENEKNIEVLIEYLSKNTSLLSLDLSGNYFNDETILRIFNTLRENNHSLTSFNLRTNSGVVSAIGTLLSNLSENLEKLDLSIVMDSIMSNNSFENKAEEEQAIERDKKRFSDFFNAISQFLTTNPHLIELDLSSNEYELSAITAFANALNQNYTLRHLNVANSKMYLHREMTDDWEEINSLKPFAEKLKGNIGLISIITDLSETAVPLEQEELTDYPETQEKIEMRLEQLNTLIAESNTFNREEQSKEILLNFANQNRCIQKMISYLHHQLTLVNKESSESNLLKHIKISIEKLVHCIFIRCGTMANFETLSLKEKIQTFPLGNPIQVLWEEIIQKEAALPSFAAQSGRDLWTSAQASAPKLGH